MSTLIRNATVIDPGNPNHGKKTDIRIERGRITAIGKSLKNKARREITGKNLFVSPGWTDILANFNDPGREYKETLESGAKAAANGGYTTVCVSPETDPVIDNKGQVEYILKASRGLAVNILPVGALSVGLKGEHFTEMYDMHLNGAVAFSDGHLPVTNADLLRRVLLYSLTFGGKVMVHPLDRQIAGKGTINEGVVSTRLGLKGIPSLAEEVMIARDLAIAEYCDAHIHFSTISSAGSVKLIRRAKKRGIKVSCDVAIANLVWTDETLDTFDSNFKVLPPLRTEKDRKALIKGVNDGTIDFIVTNHRPQNIEEKECEFELAGYGQATIEIAFGLYRTHLSDAISIEKWVEMVSVNPSKFIGLEKPGITIGNKADITVFDNEHTWTVAPSALQSKGRNNPVAGQELTGRVLEIFR